MSPSLDPAGRAIRVEAARRGAWRSLYRFVLLVPVGLLVLLLVDSVWGKVAGGLFVVGGIVGALGSAWKLRELRSVQND